MKMYINDQIVRIHWDSLTEEQKGQLKCLREAIDKSERMKLQNCTN